VVLGGIRRIAEVTQFLVPIMCVVYVGGCLVIVLRFASQLPDVLQRILESAFTGQAAMGGFAGATVKAALLNGFKRGLFSNEAGLGSAPIVHATAVTDHPVRQAAYGIFEVFMDTLVVCVMTGVSVLATGAWTSGDTGAALSARAFAIGLPGQWGHYTVSLSLVAFAFSTIIGWSYYGETAVTYLFGGRVAVPYRIAWTAFVYLGAVGSLQLVWSVADTLNGLMAIPNLIGVLGSVGLLLRMIREFFPRGRAAHGR
jgi:AGCS family alanine or glycine:cation symporter